MKKKYFLLFITLSILLTRLFAQSFLDPTFGDGGLANYNNIYPESWQGFSAALQSDGKIVVAGKVDSIPLHGVLLLRYDEQGLPDSSFGLNGIVKSGDTYPEMEYARSIALQPDGKIVVTGFGHDSTTYMQGLFVARYNSDGTADTSFSDNGYVFTSFNGNQAYFEALAIQQDGKIVVSGGVESIPRYYLTFLRYNTDGTPDLSFGTNGKVTTALSSDDLNEPYDLAIQPDGKIVAVGSPDFSGNSDFGVVRYLTNGTPDNTFGTNGLVMTDGGLLGNDRATSIAIQSDGKILAGGTMATDTAGGGTASFAVVRYDSNGNLDTQFGNGGIAIREFSNDLSRSMALAPDQKIVLTGGTQNPNGLSPIVLTTRFNADGTSDFSLGNLGIILFNDGNPPTYIFKVIVQPDGKLIITGFSGGFSGTGHFLLARFLAGPTGISDFQNNSTHLTVFPNPVSGNSTISFSLEEASNVIIDLLDISGKNVSTLLNKNLSTGNHTLDLNGENLQAGIYLLRLRNDKWTTVTKVAVE